MASQRHVKNLGAALSLIIQQRRSEGELYNDLDAFHAPSECYPLVERRIDRERAETLKRIREMTGLKFKAVVREAVRRTSPRFVHHVLGL